MRQEVACRHRRLSNAHWAEPGTVLGVQPASSPAKSMTDAAIRACLNVPEKGMPRPARSGLLWPLVGRRGLRVINCLPMTVAFLSMAGCQAASEREFARRVKAGVVPGMTVPEAFLVVDRSATGDHDLAYLPLTYALQSFCAGPSYWRVQCIPGMETCSVHNAAAGASPETSGRRLNRLEVVEFLAGAVRGCDDVEVTLGYPRLHVLLNHRGEVTEVRSPDDAPAQQGTLN